MKTRDEFVAEREPRWRELEQLLAASVAQGEATRRIAALYRALSADVMQVRSLGFGADLRRRLDALASRAHNCLYRAPEREGSFAFREMLRDFPRLVRQHWGFVAVATLLFWLPFALGLAGALFRPGFAEHVLPPETLEAMNTWYAKSEVRPDGGDSAMAGFYVYNNVGIAFRCFATGILFGAGSIFFLVFNGITLGTSFGWVIANGHGRNILTYCCGHSPFELTAIVISGAAGLQIGFALLDTGGLSRRSSLLRAGRSALVLVVGAGVFLLVAAGFEAFWSAAPVPDPVKWVVAGLNTLFVLAYLALGGRSRERRA
ncbi:MAG TPA: stage II sporulation protein M [Polyangiaceae bacterium]|nr:stage II sporulation protein M [Polyangiaceae bacterium]